MSPISGLVYPPPPSVHLQHPDEPPVQLAVKDRRPAVLSWRGSLAGFYSSPHPLPAGVTIQG
jgi:hypothetical protein